MKNYTTTKSLKNKKVYFWWSSSEILEVKFLKWIKMRNGCGSIDTNKIGIGALVYSRLIGQYKLRPYTRLYRTYNDAWGYKNPINRPELNRIK